MLPSQYIHIFIYLLTGTLFEKYLPTCLYFLVPTIQLLSSCTIPLYCSYQSGLWPPCNSVQQVLISPCISWSSLLITHSFLKSSSFFFFFLLQWHLLFFFQPFWPFLFCYLFLGVIPSHIRTFLGKGICSLQSPQLLFLWLKNLCLQPRSLMSLSSRYLPDS